MGNFIGRFRGRNLGSRIVVGTTSRTVSVRVPQVSSRCSVNCRLAVRLLSRNERFATVTNRGSVVTVNTLSTLRRTEVRMPGSMSIVKYSGVFCSKVQGVSLAAVSRFMTLGNESTYSVVLHGVSRRSHFLASSTPIDLCGVRCAPGLVTEHAAKCIEAGGGGWVHQVGVVGGGLSGLRGDCLM